MTNRRSPAASFLLVLAVVLSVPACKSSASVDIPAATSPSPPATASSAPATSSSAPATSASLPAAYLAAVQDARDAGPDQLAPLVALSPDSPDVVFNADGTAAGAGVLYMTPQGLANQSSFGSILGRPIVVTEACQTLGTEGDIVLAALSKYLSVVRGSLKTDYSIHLWFDQAINAFRFILRMNGQPWLSAAIARKNGSNTLSHFVTLAVRA